MENLKNRKVFIDYLQTIHDVNKNLEDYDPTKKQGVLVVFDSELFLRGRKLNISLDFILQSFFKVSKTIRLNATH